MPLNPAPMPDMSVEFLSWLNSELRRRANRPQGAQPHADEEEFEDDEPQKQGLVHRLKAYFLCGLSLVMFVAAQIFFGI